MVLGGKMGRDRWKSGGVGRRGVAMWMGSWTERSLALALGRAGGLRGGARRFSIWLGQHMAESQIPITHSKSSGLVLRRRIPQW